jgi:carboxypeptidase family protein
MTPARETTPAGTAVIRGTVVDEKRHAAVSGAAVHIEIQPSAVQVSASTSAAGNFRASFPLPVPGQLLNVIVAAPGYGTWRLIGQPVRSGEGYTLTVVLSAAEHTATWSTPLADLGRPSPKSAAGLSPRFARPSDPTSVYSDDYLAPPAVRVQLVPRDSNCNPTGGYPPPGPVYTYSMSYYVAHTLIREIGGGDGYSAAAIQANALAIKNYAWHFINVGARWYTVSSADIDDSTNYQCFDDQGLAIPDALTAAVSASVGRGVQRPAGTILQTDYLGFVPTNPSLTREYCGNSDGSVMYQLGTKAWGTPSQETDPSCAGQSPQTDEWMIHHYYDAGSGGPASIFTVPAPADPYVDSKRTIPSDATIHFDTKGAWQYQVFRWNGTGWDFMAGFNVDDLSGNIQTWWDDTNAPTDGAYYAACAMSSGTWSACPSIWVPAWTTDAWNASFEHGNAGQNWGLYPWGLNNSTDFSQVNNGSDQDLAMRIYNSAGTWVSIYQDVPFHSFACVEMNIRRDSGGSANVEIRLWGLGGGAPDEYASGSFVISAGNTWYSTNVLGNCFTFAQSHSTLRIEVYLESPGYLDVDRGRIVYDQSDYYQNY